MSAADQALREAAKAERARYSRPFDEGPRSGTHTPVPTDDLLKIIERRRALLAETGVNFRPLQVVRETA